LKKEKDFNELYIPFYRYLKFETRIGIRRLLPPSTKKSKLIENGGYYSLGKLRGI
jgi:hypothetical protein